jgi:signal transduction histidine kinase
MYKALDLSKTLKTREPACRVLLEIGLIESKRNPPDVSSLEEGLKIARDIDSKRLQSEFLTALADIADKTGNYKEEVSLLKQVRVLRDSIFTLDKAKEIANMEIEYELKRAHTQLSELEKAERRNADKKNIIIFIAVILALTVLTLMVFYTRSRILNKKIIARERDLKKANAIKDRLFSIIGHDLKGPIGNIPSLLNIYKNQENTDIEKEYILNAMEESSQASLETLEKLLSWGKQQIKGSVFNPSILDVEEIMQNKLRLLSVMAANKNITITNNIPPNTRINADENHFKFIIRNLLSNAVKFTHTGGHIEINAVIQPGEPYVTFSVKDDGIGIDPEMQQHIFEPYNESTTGTANEKGTSIGLMLCKEFVSQNGGDIWVESVKGEGATFYFYFKGSQVL